MWFPNIFCSESIRNITIYQMVYGFLLYTRARGAPIGDRAKSDTNILALEEGPLLTKTTLALTNKSSSTFLANNLHSLFFTTLKI